MLAICIRQKRSIKTVDSVAIKVRPAKPPLLKRNPVQTNTNAGKTIAAAVFVALAVSTTSVTADFIVQPNSINAYSENLGTNPTGWLNDANYKGIYTYDGTGLSNASLVANGAADIGNAGTNLAAMPTHDVMFNVSAGSAGRYNPATNRASPLLLQLAVDKTYDFTGVYLWNYAEYYADGPYAGWYNNRGIKNATIGFYGDAGSNFAFRGARTVDFTQTPQALNNGPQYISFNGTIPNAQFIALYINSTFESATITADTITGLNEIRFTAVPEPTTWALLAGGLATVMTLRRRLRPPVSCPKI
jgi:hypothetical protein